MSRRRIWMSILTLLLAFCIGLGLIAAASAVVISQEIKAAPTQVIPAP